MLSCIESRNAKNTVGTSLTFTLPLQKSTTASFSTMTKPYANGSCYTETSCSLTSPSLQTCEFSSLTSKALTQARKCKRMPEDDLQSGQVTPVCDGTAAPVLPPQSTASTSMYVPTAVVQTMSTVLAPTNPKRARIGDSAAKPINHLQCGFN